MQFRKDWKTCGGMGVGTGGVGVGLNEGKIRKRGFYRKECWTFLEIRSVYIVFAKVVLGYEASHHAHKWTESTSGSEARTTGLHWFHRGGLNLPFQGGEECWKIQITRRWLRHSSNTIKPALVKEASHVFQLGSAKEESRKLHRKMPLSSPDIPSCGLFCYILIKMFRQGTRWPELSLLPDQSS